MGTLVARGLKTCLSSHYNGGHNILTLFDFWSFFVTSETRYISSKNGIYDLPQKLPNNFRFWNLGN